MPRFLLALCALLAASGCRCNAASELPELTEPSATTRQEQAPARCSEVPGRSATLESPGPKVDPEQTDPPFAVELGRADTSSTGILIPFLRSDSKHTQAGLLRLQTGDWQSAPVDLGTVHSAVPAPKVTRAADAVFVAVPDGDASGGQYRLGRLLGDKVAWLAEVDEHGDDSPSFDFAAVGNQLLFTWDDWDARLGKSTIETARVDTSAATHDPRLVRVSPAETDAHSPRLLVKPDGYWISWIAMGKPAAPTDDDAPLPSSNAWLELLRLDAQGNPLTGILPLTPKAGHVTAYDVVAAHDGRLLFSVRDDGGGAEFDSASIQMIRVSVDGAIDSELVAIDDLGAGAPSLLFDPDPGNGAPHGWLALASANGSTILAGLMPNGTPTEPPDADPTLASAEPLAALRGEILVARPRGRDVDLGMLRCVPKATDSAGASPSAAP
jgi:hypothetical protein